MITKHKFWVGIALNTTGYWVWEAGGIVEYPTVRGMLPFGSIDPNTNDAICAAFFYNPRISYKFHLPDVRCTDILPVVCSLI